jgi:hypothetical protein
MQFPTFGIKHTTKAQYLTDMWFNQVNDVVSHYAVVASKEGLRWSRGSEEERAWQSGFGPAYF